MRRLRLHCFSASLATLIVAWAPLQLQASIQLSAVRAILSDNSEVSAIDAFGLVSGNDVGAGLATTLTNLQSEFGLSGWSLLGSSDVAGGPFVAHVQATSGTLLLNSPPSPLDGPFAITLKSSSDYAAFFFDATVLDVIGFKFDTGLAMLLNNKGNAQELSHSSIFTAIPPDPEPTVPEPTSLAIFSLLAMAGAVGYWKNAKA